MRARALVKDGVGHFDGGERLAGRRSDDERVRSGVGGALELQPQRRRRNAGLESKRGVGGRRLVRRGPSEASATTAPMWRLGVGGIDHRLHADQLQALRALQQEHRRGTGQPIVRDFFGPSDPRHRLVVGGDNRDRDAIAARGRARGGLIEQRPRRARIAALGQAHDLGVERDRADGTVEPIAELAELCGDLGVEPGARRRQVGAEPRPLERFAAQPDRGGGQQAAHHEAPRGSSDKRGDGHPLQPL